MSSSDSSWEPHPDECECDECCDSLDSEEHDAVVYSVINAMETICDEFGIGFHDRDDALFDELLEVFYRHAKIKRN